MGEGGVQKGPKIADMIYGEPLMSILTPKVPYFAYFLNFSITVCYLKDIGEGIFQFSKILDYIIYTRLRQNYNIETVT